MEHMLLPDVLTLPLVLAGLAAGWLQDLGLPLDRALAAGGAYLAFRTIEVAYRRLRGRDGLGQGDAKLAAAAGAWLGIASLSTVILAGALFTFALAILWRGRYALRRTTAVPFGPGLCLATWAVWLLAA